MKALHIESDLLNIISKLAFMVKDESRYSLHHKVHVKRLGIGRYKFTATNGHFLVTFKYISSRLEEANISDTVIKFERKPTVAKTPISIIFESIDADITFHDADTYPKFEPLIPTGLIDKPMQIESNIFGMATANLKDFVKILELFKAKIVKWHLNKGPLQPTIATCNGKHVDNIQILMMPAKV